MYILVTEKMPLYFLGLFAEQLEGHFLGPRGPEMARGPEVARPCAILFITVPSLCHSLGPLNLVQDVL